MDLINLAQQVFVIVSFFVGALLGFFVYKLPRFIPEIGDTLKSILFQGTMLLLALYATSSGRSTFVSSFLLFSLANSFYLQWRDYKQGEILSWFDILDETPTNNSLFGYFALAGLVFFYSVLNFLF